MAEKGLAETVEIVEVDIMAGRHRSPDHLSRFGMAQLPALELDDESIAICRYLEAVEPEPNLFGRDPKEAAVIKMWMRRCELYLANPLMLTVRFSHPALAVLEPPQPEVAAYNRSSAERFMAVLDERLANQDYLSGRFSIADIVAVGGGGFRASDQISAAGSV
ncbi:hypothetical protein LTR94_025226 [Friedmanniomyces endolithicus]|nr:hypothetical protein LTR94_025226 [Friedmanniomyces endolithicus]